MNMFEFLQHYSNDMYLLKDGYNSMKMTLPQLDIAQPITNSLIEFHKFNGRDLDINFMAAIRDYLVNNVRIINHVITELQKQQEGSNVRKETEI
jgi:hypothetical protein